MGHDYFEIYEIYPILEIWKIDHQLTLVNLGIDSLFLFISGIISIDA